jgi:hypothetical protein
MGGGLIQLVAYGEQDIFLTSNPQVTYFKVTYRRYTNFSTEMIKQNFTKDPNFGTKTTCLLSKSGDLIKKIYFVVELPILPKIVDNNFNIDELTRIAWTKRLGYNMIRFAEIEIGTQIIDKQYGEWLSIWNEITTTPKKLRGILNMIGDRDELTTFTNGKSSFKLYIPLQFWFCRETGLALPISALQHSDVKINIELKDFDDCIIKSPTNYINLENSLVNYEPYEYIKQDIDGDIANGLFINFDIETKRLYYIKFGKNSFQGTPSTSANIFSDSSISKYKIIGETSQYEGTPQTGVEHIYTFNSRQLDNIFIRKAFLLVEYVFLDIDERLKFSNDKHEYQIDTLEYNGEKQITSSNQRLRLALNHPTKELFYVANQDQYKDKYNYTNNFRNTIIKTMNGYKIGKPIGTNLITNSAIIFNGQERISYRNSEYFNWIQNYQNHTSSNTEGINTYSFCLTPEKYQPSGSANLSRIDEVTLQVRLDNVINQNNIAKIRVYSIVSNRIKISNGILGKVFI